MPIISMNNINLHLLYGAFFLIPIFVVNHIAGLHSYWYGAAIVFFVGQFVLFMENYEYCTNRLKRIVVNEIALLSVCLLGTFVYLF